MIWLPIINAVTKVQIWLAIFGPVFSDKIFREWRLHSYRISQLGTNHISKLIFHYSITTFWTVWLILKATHLVVMHKNQTEQRMALCCWMWNYIYSVKKYVDIRMKIYLVELWRSTNTTNFSPLWIKCKLGPDSDSLSFQKLKIKPRFQMKHLESGPFDVLAFCVNWKGTEPEVK